MTLQSSGAISLSDVQTEFGGSNPISMSEYYNGGSFVPSTLQEAVTPSNLTITANHNQRSAFPQFWFGPTISSSYNQGGYTGTALYAHQLWSDNGTTGTQDCSFNVNKTGTYSYYCAYYGEYFNSGNFYFYVNGSLVASHTQFGVSNGGSTSSTGTFSVTNTSHLIRVYSTYPSSGWSASTVYIGGSGYNNRTISVAGNTTVPSSGTLNVSDFYGGQA